MKAFYIEDLGIILRDKESVKVARRAGMQMIPCTITESDTNNDILGELAWDEKQEEVVEFPDMEVERKTWPKMGMTEYLAAANVALALGWERRSESGPVSTADTWTWSIVSSLNLVPL